MLSFLIKSDALEAGEMKGAFFPPFGIEDNTKFSIFWLSNYPLSFRYKGISFNHIAEINKICERKLKTAIDFLF